LKIIIGGVKIEKKYLYILIIAIIVVIAIVGVYFSGIANTSKISNSNDWKTNELAGIKFKLPEKYSGGMFLSGNVVDGVETGNSYESNNGELVIKIYLSGANTTERDKEYNSYMESNSTFEIVTISGQEATIVHNETSQPYSIAFFEVKGAQIVMKWEGSNIDGDIKAIIASFFELNK